MRPGNSTRSHFVSHYEAPKGQRVGGASCPAKLIRGGTPQLRDRRSAPRNDIRRNYGIGSGTFCLLTFLFSLGFLCNAYPAFTAPPEDVVSTESITSQTVSDVEAVAPYMITGESLVALVRHMIKFNVEGSTAIYNRNTGQLFIRNTPQNQEEVGRILNRIRDTYKQQVDIEAQVITISSTDFEGLGIDEILWDASQDVSHNLGRIGTDDSHSDNIVNSFVDFANIADKDSATAQFSVGVLSDGFNFSLFYDAVSSKAEVNTLSSPRVIVTNNQRANIQFKKAQYYVREVKSDATTDSEPVVTLRPIIGVAESGTILDVTPTINADGTINLELHPTFVRADLSATKTINIAPTSTLAADEQPSVTLPVFTNQQADTTLTVANGGTAIVGGYVGETEFVKKRELPIIKNIPVVGKILSQETRSQARTYLLMFVKATIRNPGKSFNE